MPTDIDPEKILRGKLSQGLWAHFRETFKPIIENEDLIFALGEELIGGNVFEIVDGKAIDEEPAISVTLHQLKFISVVTDQVLSTRQFRGTPVKAWGKEVVRRVRATQLLSGPTDFKMSLVLNDLDREQLVTNGFVELDKIRLELPIKVRIEMDMSERSTTKP